MKKPTLTDFINGKVTYDNFGQKLFINDPKGGVQILADLRGWGKIQHFFENKKGTHIDTKAAGEFQDMIGQWLADAVNEKLEREKQIK